MRVIIFDTETNGLIPKDKNIVTENLDKMPYIVQLSFILFDTNSMRIVVEHDFIIQVPENIEISDESAKIHGISKQISSVNGVVIKSSLALVNTIVFSLTVNEECSCNLERSGIKKVVGTDS